MIKEHYHYLESKKFQYFSFVSEGLQGQIIKIVQFILDEDNLWNLGFGDWHKGKIDDQVMSNNNDVSKVINTVGKIVYDFFEHYPDRIVSIKPVDEKRKRLYNYVFQRHIIEIEPNFDVIGFIDNKSEVYSAIKNYDSFEIKLKSKL